MIILKTKNTQVVAILSILAMIIFVFALRSNDADVDTEKTPYIPTVSLYGVGSSSPEALIRTTGEVQSKNKYDMRSEISEAVQSVNVKIGETVYPGTPLIVLKHASLSAQKAQLEASLTAEKAALKEMKSGTRPEQIAIYTAQVGSAAVALKNAESSLDDKIRDAYTRADDLVHNSLDTFFYDPLTQHPTIVFISNDSQTQSYLENNRVVIEEMLNQWKDIAYTTAKHTDDEAAEMASTAYDNLLYLREYTDSLASIVNILTPSSNYDTATITNWKTLVSGMRTGVNGAISALLAAKDALAQTQSTYTIAQRQLDLALAGATTEQLEIQKSRIAAAEANLSALQITLNKTYITSPISGTVAEVSVNNGDLVSPGQHLVTVLNENNLAITSYIAVDDIPRIRIGSLISIDTDAKGVVTRIAPSINSTTQKVEIEIALTDTAGRTFIDGQFVNLSIQTVSNSISIPLSAVKQVNEVSYVYTINTDNVVVQVPVVLGNIAGDRVHVSDGLESVASVVRVVGDLSEGDRVKIVAHD